MRLARRAEVGLGAEVQLHGAGREPAATARCEQRRLRQLVEAEDADVVGPCLVLGADRHRQLHVVDREPRRAGYSLTDIREELGVLVHLY